MTALKLVLNIQKEQKDLKARRKGELLRGLYSQKIPVQTKKLKKKFILSR
jgi:hypothetical protein